MTDAKTELSELFAQAQAGNVKARDVLVRANMGLVHSIARKVGRTRSDADMEDLVSEGTVGILTAIQKFDPARGVAFSTYAYRWIERHVHIAATELRGQKQSDKRRVHLQREADALIDTGLSLNDAAVIVAKERGVRVETVRGVHARLSARAVSIDKPVGDEGSSTLADFLGEDPQVDEQIDRARQLHGLRARIAKFRRTLAPRELAVLDQRILRDEEDSATLRDLADQFGLSRERIRQIEVKLRSRLILSLRRAKPLKRVDRVDRRVCVLCGAVLRRHNLRDRCRAHGPSRTFDMRTGRCLTCGRTVPATLRSAHLQAHRHGQNKTPEEVRRAASASQAALRSARRVAGYCFCGSSRGGPPPAPSPSRSDCGPPRPPASMDTHARPTISTCTQRPARSIAGRACASGARPGGELTLKDARLKNRLYPITCKIPNTALFVVFLVVDGSSQRPAHGAADGFRAGQAGRWERFCLCL
jgi:RNA polymerase sigma factor (sigma-70 family)